MHWVLPPIAQVEVPEAQTPWSPVWQDCPPPAEPSSTTPLQSLSTPSQVSVPGLPGVALQIALPLLHTRVPEVLQAPVPFVHEAPTLKPSSAEPLQLSSSPLHVSV